MKRFQLCFVAVAVLSVSTCWCQAVTTPRFQLFGGYSYVPTTFSFFGGGQNGWTAALDINSQAHDWIGFEAGYAQYAFQDNGGGDPLFVHHVGVWTLLWGPRFSRSLRGSGITLFAQSLIGPAHINDWLAASPGSNGFSPATSFGWANGGGIDYAVARHFAMRGEANLLYTRFSTQDNQLQSRVSDWHDQMSIGVVFRL